MLQLVLVHRLKIPRCFVDQVENDESFKIEPGKEYVSHYRYLVTSAVIDVDMVGQHWKKYAEGSK